MTIRRGYVDGGDGRWGQLHFRETGSGAAPTLVCLHATAYSGRTFAPLMPLLAASRRVIALDTPGYGGSDGPSEPVPFERYADAIADGLRSLVDDAPVDLFGYHTGASIAIDLASRLAARVRRLVLIGIPFFEGVERDAWRAKLVHRHVLEADLQQFAARWEYFINGRTPGLSLERAFECFVDELQAWPNDWWAHASLFDDDARPRLAAVHQPVLVINPAGALADASRRAASIMRDAAVVDVPELSGAIFDLGAERLAGLIVPFLE